jgi:hypothetical protein
MKDLIKNPIVKGVCAGLIGIGDIVHGIVCKD